MSELVRAIVLGAVQALTEFLPVSSSAHLVLVSELIDDSVDSLTFDVGLHVGTAAAVLGYFWRDWLRIASSGLRGAATHGVRVSHWDEHARLGLWIVVATVPAAIGGLVFGDVIERELREPLVVGVMLIGGALVIWAADRWGGTLARLSELTVGRALLLGVAQATALVPGVSRSGITIAAARGMGFDRYSATRFSFLLSAPIVVGAGIFQFGEAFSSGEQVEWGALLLGAFVSFALGAAVIRFLLDFVRVRSFLPFVLYRIVLGSAVLALVAAGSL